MRDRLPDYDFTKFNPIKPKLLDVVDGMLASDIGQSFGHFCLLVEEINIRKSSAEKTNEGRRHVNNLYGLFMQDQQGLER